MKSISVIIPAFNEGDCLTSKILNTLNLNYPTLKREIIVVTDGSDDSSVEIVDGFGYKVSHLHEKERRGKIAAMQRGAEAAKNDILVFTDANTDLNSDALIHIERSFRDHKVGMVAGEKRVMSTKIGESAAGEGMYWKYESWLKKLDSEAGSVIGAAGELFAIRRDLYEPIPSDSLLDDFMLSSVVLRKGYKVAYQPLASATEYGSESYLEEWKRKVRICAGGVQSIVRSADLFNPFKYGIKSVSFAIHRAARWTIAPLSLLLMYLASMLLSGSSVIYFSSFILFNLILIITYWAVINNKKNLPRLVLLPVYFTFMHASAIAGWFRYFSGTQSVNWERAKRISVRA